MAIRNAELAVIQRNDPARLRSRTVETSARKIKNVRSRRKQAWRREEVRA